MEDTIKLPLDADGVPIRPGDIVFVKRPKGEPKAMRVKSLLLQSVAEGWAIGAKEHGNAEGFWLGADLTHTKPDTLEDIEKAINELIEEATLDYLAEAEIKEKVAPLMERIKRMVER